MSIGVLFIGVFFIEVLTPLEMGPGLVKRRQFLRIAAVVAKVCTSSDNIIDLKSTPLYFNPRTRMRTMIFYYLLPFV